MKAWSYPDGKPLRSFPGHTGNLGDALFTPDGRSLVSGGDSTVRIWDPATGAETKRIDGAGQNIMSIDLAPDGKTVVAGGYDGRAHTFSLESGAALRTFNHSPGKRILAVAFDKTGHTLATAGDDATMRTWNVETGELQKTFVGHTGPINDVLFAPDGGSILTSADDHAVRIWNNEGYPAGRFVGAIDEVWSIAISPDGESLATAGKGGWVRIYHRTDRTLRLALWTQAQGNLRVRFAFDSQTIATGDAQGRLSIYPLPNANQRANVPRPKMLSSVPPPDPVLVSDAAMADRARRLINDSGQDSSVYAAAEKLAAQAIALNPKNALAHVQLARIAAYRGWLTGLKHTPESLVAANAEVDVAEKIDPKLPAVWIERAWLHYFGNNLDNAISDARVAHQLTTDVSVPLANLDSELAIAQKDYDTAAKISVATIETSTNRQDVLRAYSDLEQVYQGRYELDAADQVYRLIIELDPQSSWNKGNYASFLINVDRAEEAVAWCKAAIAQLDYGAVHATLASAYSKLGVQQLWQIDLPDEACKNFDLALLEDSRNATAHYGKAACLQRAGLMSKDQSALDGARKELKKALAIDPKMTIAQKALDADVKL